LAGFAILILAAAASLVFTSTGGPLRQFMKTQATGSLHTILNLRWH
jgi:hypothetical protein